MTQLHKEQTISIVDNLAEITRHHDRQLLEQSLLTTIKELFPARALRLFRVREFDNKPDITPLAYCFDDGIVSDFDSEKSLDIPAELEQAFESVITSGEIHVCDHSVHGEFQVLYPVFDSHDDLYAIFVSNSTDLPSDNDQKLIYGILSVYSNYLALIEKTQRDKLTGLYNRETLDDEIAKILVKQQDDFLEQQHHDATVDDQRRHDVATKNWLGVVDIDHFKSINDNYGHLYGDEVIILVARLMGSGLIRETDLVYRYGGEEFVVLLRAPSEHDAAQAFERLRRLIAEHHFPQIDKVTVSIGFVEIGSQQTPSDVIGQADDALYYAKQNGRNQVHSYRALLEDCKIAESSKVIKSSEVELF